MIREETRNIGLRPLSFKELEKTESYVPYQVELRNGVLTLQGYWKKRPGYTVFKNIGVNKQIVGLIPFDAGYIIGKEGNNYYFYDWDGNELYGSPLSGSLITPSYCFAKDYAIVCTGTNVVKIRKKEVSLLSGSPPSYPKFITRIGDYILISGYRKEEDVDRHFSWSAPGNPENWTSGGASEQALVRDGQKIRNMKSFKERLYFFKDYKIEVWFYRGGIPPFVRLMELEVPKGVGEAGNSVVQANNTFYFYGDDRDFYVLEGSTPRVISAAYRAYLAQNLKHPESIIGFDCRKEHAIRWLCIEDELCLKFDYLHGFFSEDNLWLSTGEWGRLPFCSYTEKDDEQYWGGYNPTGEIYHWSYNYKDDNNLPIRVVRHFKVRMSPNGNRTKCNRLRFAFERGVASASVPQPVATFSFKWDDDADWIKEEVIDLGVKGDYSPIIDFLHLGIGKELEIKLVETDAVKYLVKDVYLTSKALGR